MGRRLSVIIIRYSDKHIYIYCSSVDESCCGRYKKWMNIALRRLLHNHGNIAMYRRASGAGTMFYSYSEWLQGFFIVHNTIGSNAHSRPLNSLEHCNGGSKPLVTKISYAWPNGASVGMGRQLSVIIIRYSDNYHIYWSSVEKSCCGSSKKWMNIMNTCDIYLRRLFA